MCGYLYLPTTFENQGHEKAINLQYMIVETSSAYNVIFGRLALNALVAAISYPHLCMKYPLPNSKVDIVKGDQMTARKCYAKSAKVNTVQSKPSQSQDCGFLDLVQRLHEPTREAPEASRRLKEIKIGPADHQKTKISVGLAPDAEKVLIKFLADNLDLFTWSPRTCKELTLNLYVTIYH